MIKENSVRVGFISLFSNEHLHSAVHLAKLSNQVELSFAVAKEDEGVPFYSHRAYVTGAIMLSVAFLEARINELIVGTSINVNPWNEDMIDKARFRSLQELAKIGGIKYLQTLEKYQILLAFFDKNPFNIGSTPYQDVALLIALRNKLTHFEPERIDYIMPQHEDEEHHFLKKFRSKKLPLNPIAIYSRRTNFPDILLGYGCAKWAIKSCISFVSDFDSKLRLVTSYKNLEKELP